MTAAAKRRATYEDLLRVPDHLVAELIDGELYVMSRPSVPHATAAAELWCDIGPPFRRGSGGPGGWIILQEPELHFGGDVLVPDIAGWRRERMPEDPDASYIELAPDWVCEILSPSTRNLDRTIKMEVYARESVRHLWHIDPATRTLDIFRLKSGNWTAVAAFSDEAVVRAEPFDAIEISLARLWTKQRN